MPTALRRFASAAILALCVLGAAANVAQAASAMDHGCCDRSAAQSSAAAETPCHGFLPLTCCRAAALPGSDPGAPAPPNFATVADSASQPIQPRVTSIPPPPVARAPRDAAIRLSVVLQV